MEYKFLCDQMLLDLGKWLRAAGYDCAFADTSQNDQSVLQQAFNENRFLLTCDRDFLKSEERERIVYFENDSLDQIIKHFNRIIKINWLFMPFSRCLKCNNLLLSLSKESLKDEVPLRIFEEKDQFWYCDKCHKIFWHGSHTQNMLKQLEYWATI